jgi:hypothetical protein
MSNEKTGTAASASRALKPTDTNPLDFVPDKILFVRRPAAQDGIKALMVRGFHKPGMSGTGSADA